LLTEKITLYKELRGLLKEDYVPTITDIFKAKGTVQGLGFENTCSAWIQFLSI
jgi:hypothetical protein